MKECPCRDCKDREIDCHGKCIFYKEWFEENKRIRQSINNKKALERIGQHEWRKRLK